MTSHNQRTRFIFDDFAVRGLHVQLNDVWQHIVSQKHYPMAIRRALGQLLAAGSLLSSNLKMDGTLIVNRKHYRRCRFSHITRRKQHFCPHRTTQKW